MRNYVTLPNFTGVAAGQTATMMLPSGGNMTYDKIVLEVGLTNAGGGSQANVESYLTGIRLKINGKTQRTFSAKQLDSINAFYNRSFQTRNSVGYLEIFFGEPWRRTPAGEDALQWGTANVPNFSLEVDIAAGATGPTLTPFAEVEYVAKNIGAITKWRQYQQQVTAAGLTVNNTLPKSLTEAYQALHCFPVAPTDITTLSVKTDQVIRWQASYYDMQSLLQSYYWAPQAGMYHVVFDRTGRVSDALPMQYLNASGKPSGTLVGNFELDWTMNAANSFPFVAQVLGNPD